MSVDDVLRHFDDIVESTDCDVGGDFIDDDFLHCHGARDVGADETTEGVLPSVRVEHSRVVHGLVGDIDAERGEHSGRNPHALPHFPVTIACHLVAGVVDDVVENEEEHGYDKRCADTTFANDGSERCTDEEENQAGNGECEFLDELDFVATD